MFAAAATMSDCRIWIAVGLALFSPAMLSGVSAAEGPADQIEFNRDIRPILSDNCYQCHGPDKAKRKAQLRLDIQVESSESRLGRPIVVAGHAEQSDLFQRITAKNVRDRMPPASTGRRLSPKQIELVRHWIDAGARRQAHWSFMPPKRPALPEKASRHRWVRNPIDAFIFDRLEREQMHPSPEADRATWIRRVTFDLTGLPPTPDEVDVFCRDLGPNAHEKVVDRLLLSPHYGERMAVRWLDAARYADTNGYQSDGERTMWRWRDWVIDAFNSNMPFDQFTIEQLAGDLLPTPTLDQLIATGFNRNHRGNAEGGIIPEEYAVEYVVDRVETTSTVWLGLTMTCARCHDHKFDPFSQRDFYQLFAYFNSVPERGKAIKFGNSPPTIRAPTAAQREQLRDLDTRLAAAEEGWRRLAPQVQREQRAWESRMAHQLPRNWTISARPLMYFSFDGDLDSRESDGKIEIRDGNARFCAGKIGAAAEFDGRRYVSAGNVANFGYLDKFALSAWIYCDDTAGGTIISRMTDAARPEGYSLSLESGRVQFRLVKRWLDDALRVETEHELAPRQWHHVAATYDGSRAAEGMTIFIDGAATKLRVLLDDLNQTFQTAEPLRIGATAGPTGRFRGKIDEARIDGKVLSADEIAVLAMPNHLSEICALPELSRSAQQSIKLRTYFLENGASTEVRSAFHKRQQLKSIRSRLIETFPSTMIMLEMPQPREAHVLVRGVYDKPGPKVARDIPRTLGAMHENATSNRLSFARWLVGPANPLTARVAVNRFWQMYFGAGLVKTVDDFGAQGDWPSHPELLDWLATEFMRSKWNVKEMQRLITTSATYRQSARVTQEQRERDPDNRWLGRGPRMRLSAQMIRDQALAASGLLVRAIGGPSVRPYQPPGLWKELADTEYIADKGDSLYRRSLYTFWKRTVGPPVMTLFDAAGRETCVVRETRTNTPLQALTLMNEVTFVEAARKIAERCLHTPAPADRDRVSMAFRLVLARQPHPAELDILLAQLDAQRTIYRANLLAADKLTHSGESPRDARTSLSELAAYTVVASLILNLDEAVMKE